MKIYGRSCYVGSIQVQGDTCDVVQL